MSKPKDPVLAVLTYFETTDLALARQTLAVVQHTLRKRNPGSGAVAAARKPRGKLTAGPAGGPALTQLSLPPV